MATWRVVQTALLGLVNQAISDAALPSSITAKAAVGYPPVAALQNTARSGVLFSIYDHAEAKDVTRWFPDYAVTLTLPATTVSITGPGQLNQGVSGTITLTGSPTLDDAVAIVSGSYAATAVASTTVTSDLAQTLFNNANGFFPNLQFSYTAGANTIDVQNLNNGIAYLSYSSGSVGTELVEIRRVLRNVQITAWANSPALRDQVCDQLEQIFSNAQLDFGIQFPDQTWGRVMLTDDIAIEENTLQDVYRRDFIATCEYGITTQDTVWSVLANVANINGGF